MAQQATAAQAASEAADPLPSAQVWDSFSRLSALDIVVVGSLSGTVSKTLTAPIDRVRLKYQVSPSETFSLRECYRTAVGIVRQSGPQGLWKGNVATIWRVAPFSGIQFLVWDLTHVQLRSTLNGSGSAAFVAGAVAGVTAVTLTYPLDVLRARQAMGFDFQNYPAAVEGIMRKEGVAGFFKGFKPTIMGMVPYGAISFGTFEALKQELRRQHGVSSDTDVPMLEQLAAGSLSGAAAQLCAYPLHIVRRRMQVETSQEIGAQGSLAYSSTRRALVQIKSTEGVINGLYKSLTLTWLKGPLTVGVAFVTNDTLKQALHRHYVKLDGDHVVPLYGQAHYAAEKNDPSRRKLTVIEGLVCGGCAGSIAKTAIAPGDRVKILFQTDTTTRFSWRGALDTACGIVSEQGVRGLWRGHGATLLRVAPYSATSFTVFEPYKAKVKRHAPELPELYVRFLAGAAAGTTATTLTYPFDLFRARMAAHRGLESPYQGYLRAAKEVVRTEGVLALWSGLRPTLLGIVPYAGISFCCFETLKARVAAHQMGNADASLAPLTRLACGALSGLLAQSVTYPLDIVRRRVQVDPGIYRNELHALVSIYRADKLSGLFKGLSMNWVKGPIAVGISFAVNDFLREAIAKQ